MSETTIPPLCDAEVGRRAAALGFALPPDAVSGLAVYLGLLMRWNAVMNLVGAGDWVEALENLAADSFHLAGYMDSLELPPDPVTWDLGAGAGLPGIPLRLLWKKGAYWMVESREKRALFLQTALARLALPRTSVARARAEEFFRASDKADCIVSRAFMPWRDLLALVPDQMRPAGKVVFLTLEPGPGPLPDGWRAHAPRGYVCNRQKRYFWCLERCS